MNTNPFAVPSRQANREQSIEALYATAQWLLTRDRPRDAADVFCTMAFFAPADERAWLGLGTCHAKMEEPQKALEMYETGAALARSVRCEMARSRALSEAGRHREAEEALDHATRM
jgi:tetratricopeptide (TPR) repeat protein